MNEAVIGRQSPGRRRKSGFRVLLEMLLWRRQQVHLEAQKHLQTAEPYVARSWGVDTPPVHPTGSFRARRLLLDPQLQFLEEAEGLRR